MSDRFFRRLTAWTLLLMGTTGAGALALGERSLLVGLLVGGLWNLVNLFCLGRLLAAWLGPQRSTRRVVGWLLLKFLGLYVLAFWLLRQPAVHPVGFGVGFTIVLATAVTLVIRRLRRLMTPVTHDR